MLFLIAHKVRGERALDVAIQMDCPGCMDAAGTNYGCTLCEQRGYWWIIPTSGHRAYPYWSLSLEDDIWDAFSFRSIPPMPEGLRDHYTAEPSRSERPQAPAKQMIFDDQPKLEDL